jgi:AcrR family transcriptional regulator
MTTPGLREQKKRRTREAIRSAALDLFERQGYSATTVDQIAAAAEVSPATFFRYFPTKEAVVITDEYDDVLADALRDTPSDEPPLEQLRRMFKLTFGQMAAEQDFSRLRWRHELLFSDPHLRGAIQQLREQAIQRMAREFAAATGRPVDDLRTRLVARLAIEAGNETFAVWIDRGGKESLPDLIDEAFDALRDGLVSPSRPPAHKKPPGTDRSAGDRGETEHGRPRK